MTSTRWCFEVYASLNTLKTPQQRQDNVNLLLVSPGRIKAQSKPKSFQSIVPILFVASRNEIQFRIFIVMGHVICSMPPQLPLG